MAKRTIKEKEITGYLQEEGFKEIKAAEKHAKWYKKASERPACLKAAQKKKKVKLLPYALCPMPFALCFRSLASLSACSLVSLLAC